MNHVVKSGDSHLWEPTDLRVRDLPPRPRGFSLGRGGSGVETIRIGPRTVRLGAPALERWDDL